MDISARMGRMGAFATAVASLLSGGAEARAVCGSPDVSGTSVCLADPAIDALAVCNDGTPAAFSFRPGLGVDSRRWVIWLEGGGQCTDRRSCIERAHGADNGLLSSAGLLPATGTGILSPDPAVNPLLFDVNMVIVHYCSSDDWAGGHASQVAFDPGDPSTWHFQGRRIALAAIASIAEIAPGFQHARWILLGGSSAGGLGITVTANDILPTLPPADNIRVVNDAGYAIDVGQYDPDVPAPYQYEGRHNAFRALFKSGMALWSGRGDAKCAAAAKTQQEQIDCFSAKVFQKHYIAVPSFIAESQLDQAQLSDEICPKTYGRCAVQHEGRSMEGQYAAAFASEMAQSLRSAGRSAVYSPDAYIHTMLTSAKAFAHGYDFPDAKLSPQGVFYQWLEGHGRVVDIGSAGKEAVPF